MQLPDRMSVTDPGFVCPLCKEYTCLGLTLLPSHLEGSRVVDSLTDARTIAVKCTQSKDCLGNVTDISKYSRGPIIVTRVTFLILR